MILPVAESEVVEVNVVEVIEELLDVVEVGFICLKVSHLQILWSILLCFLFITSSHPSSLASLFICVSGTQVTLIKYLEGNIVLYSQMLGDSNYIIYYVRIYNIGMHM